MSQIHILNHQTDEILDYITAKNIISDNHKKSLEDTLETYDFITFADKQFSQYLEKRNRIIISDEDDSLREFVIFEGHRYRDTEGHKVQVYANASYLELKKASIIYPNSFKGTASQHAGRALNDTGWQVGIVEVSGDITININEHTNPYENLKRIAKEFKAELRFRIEHDGSKVTGRYVDLLERVGDWQGREVTFGKDLDTIRRVEKQDIVTALLGLGPEKEDGTRIEVLVEDNDALQRWGRIDENGKLKHLIEVYEIQSERTEMTEVEARRYTRTALDKRIDTQVTYETTIVDLEEVAGHENKKIRFGDTIRIKDEKFNPPLYLEARVFEMTRSIKRKDKKDIKLGDYIEYTEEEVNALWEQLKKEIQDRLARLVIATVVSSGGDVFKNGIGTTQLTAKTFVNGSEVDEDGERYDYQWIKFDKDSKQVDGFIETGKTVNVTANDIDEKATYRVLVAYGLDVVTTVDYTLTHLFDGAEGKPGKDGEDGKSSYTHVRYSQNANGSGMNTNPTNAVYIGIAVTESPVAPTTASDYEWSKIKGDDGVGTPGADGKTSYVHIKYSNDGGKTFTSNNGEDPGDYIGTYTDFVQADSNDVKKYTWAKVKGDKGDKGDTGPQGIPGQKGADGKTYYTWVKYANTPTSGMSDNPSGKDYIGIAYNKESPTMSTKYGDYTWSLFKGPQGVQGQPGADGEPTYTWVKYADTENGSGMSDSPKDKLYIGLAFNKKTATESNNASDYTWSLMPQNIEIGGRNLLKNTENINKWSGYQGSNITKSSIEMSDEWGIKEAFKVKITGGTHVIKFIYSSKHHITGGLSLDANYVYSVYFKNTGQKDINYFINGLSENRGSQNERVKPGESRRLIFKGKRRIDYDWFQPRVQSYGVSDELEFIIAHEKVEKSTKTTDWTPAPEDVDKSIREVKATADGKNSVFRQNTQPSTTGRKVGDVWFQTNNDNKMHTFNGTSWVAATFGEQAITAESITALHIKGLEGLNINDQFFVDQNGNVFMKGDITGVSGEFGSVTAGTDNFLFKDESTGDLSLATPKGNLITNHSFNFLKPDYSKRWPSSNAVGVLNGGSTNDRVGWFFSATKPRMVHDAQPGTFGYVDRYAMFGLVSLIINDESWAGQRIYLNERSGTYTYSAHIKRPVGYASGGGIRLRVRCYDSNDSQISTEYIDKVAPTNLTDIYRTSFTFTTPAGTKYINVYIAGTNERWIQVDGVQLVEGEYMTPYQPDDEIAYIGHGLSYLPSLNVGDDGIVSGGPGTFHRINSIGDVNVSDGLVYVPDWYSNTSSSSTNARVSYSTSQGRHTTTLYRVTSASKYKVLIEDVNIDPYKILNLNPKSWYDKNSVEMHADELSRRYFGDEDYTANVEPNALKRSVGLKAEDVADAGLESYVDYNHEGEIEGIQYDRLWTLLIPIVRDLREENTQLKDKINDLIERVKKQENAE